MATKKEAKTTKPAKVATPVVADNSKVSNAKDVFVRGIIGIALLLVFGSIAFSVVVIWTGTDNVQYKILTAPAALFDVIIAFVAFSKILK